MNYCRRCTVDLPKGTEHVLDDIDYCAPCAESVYEAGLEMEREAAEDARVDAYLEARAEEGSKK
jgi:hypothetical protein